MYKRIIILVMDSVGIGHAPDAAKFNDEGSNTLGHIEATAGLIHCPTLRSLGLANIADIKSDETLVMGAYGKMEEVSTGRIRPVVIGNDGPSCDSAIPHIL